MRLDVVIPTLDEEEQLVANLPSAMTLADLVVVSDGGSTDRTRSVAADHGARVVIGPSGRGMQIRRGVEALLAARPDCGGRGHVLLFLHADARLPADARERLAEEVSRGAIGGGFRLVYDSPRPIYHLAVLLIHRRTLWTRCPLGDQAQWVRRDVWQKLDGVKSWPILEDVDFARRMKRRGRIAIIDSPVLASPRRFESQGILKTVSVDWLIWALYFVGVSPFRLDWLYRRAR